MPRLSYYNMYACGRNDPANSVDPNGASYCGAQYSFEECFGTGGPMDHGFMPWEEPWKCWEMVKAMRPGDGYGHVMWSSSCTPFMQPGMPLLMAALAAKAGHDCFVQLKYRPVDDIRAMDANHAFLWLQRNTGEQLILSGFPNEWRDGKIYLRVAAKVPSKALPGDPPEDSVGDATWWSTDNSTTLCQRVETIIDAHLGFSRNNIAYRAILGPNSNSAARYLLSQGGFTPSSPPRAWAWSARIPILE